MAKMNVRTGDQVEVLSGKDKGVRGEVIKAMPKEGKVVVRGVAMVKKAQRPTQQNEQGGIIQKEAAIDVSNVALVCPSCGQHTRVGHERDENNKPVRVCKKCGAKF
ncbi:50S ribosomal protein L24 [Olsenella porci]|jgi:large subunit ribosomal protein L24|uniref:Large ribosomal subunit protein uL24 n=1 Tax=Olsenella porci TaxID=2652279 RepID=A0A6N7XKP1_9ACTN|nr:50S ribosomal protein L24 [Olsenella porci]MCC6098241.1 50S ribosomal protein L24 [Olsenella sp.]MCI1997168.1 50S ribosomal protein L24 [Olsenella sp.]MST71798.1 50S ribosomal protein L24 [Olsenella porci]